MFKNGPRKSCRRQPLNKRHILLTHLVLMFLFNTFLYYCRNIRSIRNGRTGTKWFKRMILITHTVLYSYDMSKCNYRCLSNFEIRGWLYEEIHLAWPRRDIWKRFRLNSLLHERKHSWLHVQITPFRLSGMLFKTEISLLQTRHPSLRDVFFHVMESFLHGGRNWMFTRTRKACRQSPLRSQLK